MIGCDSPPITPGVGADGQRAGNGGEKQPQGDQATAHGRLSRIAKMTGGEIVYERAPGRQRDRRRPVINTPEKCPWQQATQIG
jgi:hypothetical protein